MIGVADARWARIAGGMDVAIPVEDVDLIGFTIDDLDGALLDAVREDDLVFDLGASVGVFSLLAAMRGARVVAVEASPRRAEHIGLSAASNRLASIEVVHAAVTGRTGTARYLSRRRERRVVEGSSSNDLVPVPASTAADLVARHGSPNVVRINTPGWEVEASALEAPTVGVHADLLAMAARGARLADVAGHLAPNTVWVDDRVLRPLDLDRPHPEGRIGLWAGRTEPPVEALTDDERVDRYDAEARRNPGARRARLAADLRHGGALLDDGRVQALLERLLLDPAERVVRAARWWRSHPSRATTLVDRAHALQAVLATRLSLD